MTASEILMVVFTGVIAITGIVGSIIFGGQLRIMQNQLDEMKSAGEHTKRAADAAKDSADATRDAVKLSDKTAERQLRAYVHLDPEKNIEKLRVAVGEEPIFMLRFRNFGLTPAYNLIVKRGTGIGPWPPPKDAEFAIAATVSEGGAIVPAGSISFWGSDNDGPPGKTVSAEEFSDITAGKRRFYIFGQATYTDAFRIERHTNFCLAVLPPSDSNSGDFGLQRCPQHNDAD